MCYNSFNESITPINERKISMDEFNNNENKNFGEESFSEKERREEQNVQNEQPAQYDPYNMPLEQQSTNGNAQPYNMSYSNGPQQVPPNFDPYKQPMPQNPYNGMYVDQNGMPYKTGLATASLVLGILSLVLTFSGFIFIPPLGLLPIVGLILGCVYKSKHYPVGKGLSTAGIICSVIALVLSILFIVLCVYIVMNYMPQMMEFLKSYSPEVYDQYYDMFHEAYPEWFETVAALFSKFIIK